MNDKKKPNLSIVPTPVEPRRVGSGDFAPAEWQTSLFASHLEKLLACVNVSESSESDFMQVLTSGRPRFVIDLRISPRFDIGTLNRRIVFAVFDQIETMYVDLAAKVGIRTSSDARLNPALIVEEVRKQIFQGRTTVYGPIVFLVEGQQASEAYELMLAKQMDKLSISGWELLRVPHANAATQASKRELVFISHANPEDNDFARWLYANLSLLGYRVWADVNQFIGGERFWDDIEDAIREHATKVVVCVSRIAQSKDGVLDEIHWALSTERAKGLKNFILPIRIDDLPFGDVRANLGRRNLIDFSHNWKAGLGELTRALERDGVARPLLDELAARSLVSTLRRRSQSLLIREQEPVLLNQIEINSLPSDVHFYEFEGPIKETREVCKQISVATFEHWRLIGTFASIENVESGLPPHIAIKHRHSCSTKELLSGHLSGVPPMPSQIAEKKVVALLRDGWDQKAQSKGLSPFQTAAKRIAWFPNKGLIPGGTVTYVDRDGTKRRKNIWGFSQKRGVYWHFAVEAWPAVNSGNWHYKLRPHVIFSADGVNVRKMHALRRGFCKSWWNDRWRDLLQAYVVWVAEGQPKIQIFERGLTGAVANSMLRELVSPVSIASPAVGGAQGDDDWLDDPDLDDSELEIDTDTDDQPDEGPSL